MVSDHGRSQHSCLVFSDILEKVMANSHRFVQFALLEGGIFVNFTSVLSDSLSPHGLCTL
uniref:Uncharacterized protein n=1 Tax=Anguilla anguilla TaxID=7936 RepID=A0A0E9SCZ4_ANGAN